MIRHHPSGDLLASYAAGGLNAGAALVVGSHVEVCADCRTEISLLNGLGGLLLARAGAGVVERRRARACAEKAGRRPCAATGVARRGRVS